MARCYVPDQGDVVWLHFTPQSGHEQAGHRLALVLTAKRYNQRSGMMICCPITNQIKSYPFEVVIEGNRDVTGAVLSDQVKCLDWQARQAKLKGRVNSGIVRETQRKIKALLEIP